MAFDCPNSEDLISAYRITPGDTVKLADRPCRDETFFHEKDDAEQSLEVDADAIDELQDKLFAERTRALLVILQGIDTAGKSGTTKAVFAKTSPVGMQVKAYKAPSAEEAAHDYLWRVHEAVPRKGYIGIFDRSHYEDVLVPKARGLLDAKIIDQRYDQINAFEKHLTENGVVILKFHLHISHTEQGERLKARLEKPHKRWKFNPGDLEDRAIWDRYIDAYETMLNRCSTEHAPWHTIPSDSKTRRNATIARIVRQKLEEMNPDYPDPGYRLDDFDIKNESTEF
ncbi:MAG: PPK2 family polyphosphate kinase [Pseudomonadota bacterium]